MSGEVVAVFCHNSANAERDLLTMTGECPELPSPTIVDLSPESDLADALRRTDVIGIDTEFIREKTYFSQLCLIQVANGAATFCADPLAKLRHGDKVEEFWELLTATPWVLHSGRQDIEVLYQASGKMPTAVFDTQIAAALLGYQPQIGYGGLVAELFGDELAKTHTRADWSRRPLPPEYIEYAALDVHYLLPARELLAERLEKLGRLAWAAEDSAALLDRSLYDVDTRHAIDRIKGAGKLRGAARVAAEALASWREQQALQRNRPRQWILRDAALLEIAASGATRPADLAKINGLPRGTIERSGRALLACLEAAAGSDSDYTPPARPDEAQKKALGDMRKLVAKRARETGIAAEIIAPRRALASAISGDTSSRVFSGWRQVLVGDDLLRLVEGG